MKRLLLLLLTMLLLSGAALAEDGETIVTGKNAHA